MASPWYMYRMDDPSGTYGKIRDPLGPYLKPDVNICVPGGVPITALWSGTVTNVNRSAQWHDSVTIAADNPPNKIATHTAYNWMGNAVVSKGDRIQAGQTVGYSRGGSGVCTAFAFTHDDTYGDGTFSQYNGDPRLNPYPYLLAFRAGKPLPVNGGGNGNGTGTPTTGNSALDTFLSAIGLNISGLSQWVVNIGKDIGIFLIAVTLVVLGIILLAGKQIADVGKKAGGVAILA